MRCVARTLVVALLTYQPGNAGAQGTRRSAGDEMDTECWPHQAAGAAVGLALRADHGHSGNSGLRRHSESSAYGAPALGMRSHNERAGVDNAHPCWHHTRAWLRMRPSGCATKRAGAATLALFYCDFVFLFVTGSSLRCGGMT